MTLYNKAVMFVNELEDVATRADDNAAGTRVIIKHFKSLDDEARKELIKEASIIIVDRRKGVK